MTSVRPINPRATVTATFDVDWPDDGVPAGHWHFYSSSGVGPRAGILFGCPCGCGEMMSVAIKPSPIVGSKRPVWQWDGNEELPTLSPSINILQLDQAGNRTGEHWHGYLTAGVFKSC